MEQLSTLLLVFGVAFVAFIVVIAAMAVGVMMGRRQISGSCGGLANRKGEDGQTSCALCSRPSEACRELGRRMSNHQEPLAAEHSGECDKDCAIEGCSEEKIASCKSSAYGRERAGTLSAGEDSRG